MKPSESNNLLSFDNEAYYNIFNNMQEIMAIFEIIRDEQNNPKDMIIKDVNKTYTLHLGIPREKVINKRASLIYSHEFVDHYFKLVQKTPEIGKGKSFETYFPPLDKHYLTTIFSIGNDLYVTLGIDITKRKNLEIELEKERNNLELKVQERTKELLESQRKLTEAQTIAHLGNWELDLKTNKLWFSDEVYYIFGYNPESKKVPDLQKLDATYDILLNTIVHPDDREFLDKSFKDALKGDIPYNINHRIILPNGEERIIHEQAELLFNEDKIPIKMSGTIQDITEFKQMEEALCESEEKFREIFNKANDMITLGEIKENGMPGNFIEVNEVGCERLGYTKDELLKMTPKEITVPEEIEKMELTYKELIEKGHTFVEKTHLTKDMSKIPVEVNNHLFNMKGKPVALAISRNITERKKMEQELVESEEKFREIFDKANDMITLGTFKENGLPGNFIEVNEVGCKRLGYSKEEFREMTPADIVAPDRRVEMANNAVELWTKGHATFEIVHIAKDGRSIPVEVNNHLFKMKGKTVALAISRDITEHKKSEKDLKELLNKLSRSNEKLELFADITFYDLQEPLETITGFAQLLKEQYKGKLDSNADKIIDQIVDDSIRMKQMIHNLHEKSELE